MSSIALQRLWRDDSMRSQLELLQRDGIDRETWNIYGCNGGDFPLDERRNCYAGFSDEAYVDHKISWDNIGEKDGKLFVLHNPHSLLVLKLRSNRVMNTQEMLRIGRYLGQVPVREHIIELDYDGWRRVSEVDLSGNKRRGVPYRIVHYPKRETK